MWCRGRTLQIGSRFIAHQVSPPFPFLPPPPLLLGRSMADSNGYEIKEATRCDLIGHLCIQERDPSCKQTDPTDGDDAAPAAAAASRSADVKATVSADNNSALSFTDRHTQDSRALVRREKYNSKHSTL